MTFLAYLLILPILFNINTKIRSLASKIYLPVPNALIGVLFITNLVYGSIVSSYISGIDNHGTVEIKEFVMALILFLLPISWMDLEKIKLRSKLIFNNVIKRI